MRDKSGAGGNIWQKLIYVKYHAGARFTFAQNRLTRRAPLEFRGKKPWYAFPANFRSIFRRAGIIFNEKSFNKTCAAWFSRKKAMICFPRKVALDFLVKPVHNIRNSDVQLEITRCHITCVLWRSSKTILMFFPVNNSRPPENRAQLCWESISWFFSAKFERRASC